MKANQAKIEEELSACFIRANPDWRDRLREETRHIHYDYESDILFLKFGSPGFVFMTWLDSDDEGFEWAVEDETLHIVGIHIMDFRQYYAPRYPRLQAAYNEMLIKRGEGDCCINLPPQADTKEPTAATAFADALLDCARDPTPVPN